MRTRALRYWPRARQARLFISIAAITLGAGIGVSTAVFGLVDGIFLRPSPIHEADRVLVMWPVRRSTPKDQAAYSLADYRALEIATRAFSSVAAVNLNGAAPQPVGPPGSAEMVNTAFVTDGFVHTLGLIPTVGRPFETIDRDGGPGTGVELSYRYWQRAYGSDPNAIGQPIMILGLRYVIRGVLPRGFDYPRGTDLWLAMSDTAKGLIGLVDLVGRLAPGAAPVQGRAELDALLNGPNAPDPSEGGDVRAASEPIEGFVTGSARPLLLALGAAVGLLLLMTVVNAIFLVVSRAVDRVREVAVRSAIGASRGQATAPLARECLVMSSAGAALAIAVAVWVLHALLAFAPPELPRLDAVTFGWGLAAAAFGMSCALGAGLGAIARRVATVAQPYQQLTDRTPPRGARRWTQLLVVSQIASAVVVLVGAGLTLRSLDAMLHIDLGFAGNRLLVGRLLPAGRYLGDSAWDRALGRAVATIDAVPGVAGAAPMIAQPFTGHTGWDTEYILDGQPSDAVRTNPQLALYTATLQTFRVLGVPLLAGRNFSETDGGKSPPVAIVSARAARTLWPGRTPIGQRIRLGDETDPWETVVGVVGDNRYRDLLATRATVYRPQAQAGIAAGAIAVRTTVDPARMATVVARDVNAGPDVRISSLIPVARLATPILARFRFTALLLSAVAIAAIVLAIAGLYGTMATLVERRRQEIGIRIALGALPRAVVTLVAKRGAILTVSGLFLGGCGAWAATRLLSTLLYGVPPNDPATFIGAGCLLIVVAIVACFVPTRRAVRVDPITTTRAE